MTRRLLLALLLLFPFLLGANPRDRQKVGYRGRVPKAMLGRQTSGPPPLPVVSGLIGHYDFGLATNLRNATDGSGSAVTNGQEIKWVRDLSGNGKHLAMSTASGPTWQQNTYNGRGCGRFNAHALTTAANIGITNNECTVIFMGNLSSVAGLGLIAVATTNYTTAGSNWYGIAGVGGVYKMEASGAQIDTNSTLPYNDSKLHCFSAAVACGATPLKSLRSDAVAEFTDAPGASYNITDNFFTIGGWNTVNYFVGDCCACLVYNRKLSQTEMGQVELWLANLYGLYAPPGITWPNSYDAIAQASIYSGSLNANQLRTTADPLKYDFDGEDIDELGTANASLTDLQNIATWKNRGGAAAGGDATQGTAANQPTLQKNLQSGMDAVMFGGNFDILSVTGSQADLSFMHNTNAFDVWIVGRKDLASRQVMFSNTDLATESGFVIDFDSNGKGHVQITKGGGVTIASQTLPSATPVGNGFIIRVYGGGSATGIAEVIANIGAAGSNSSSVGAGDATNLASIGSLASTASGSFDGGIFRILVFNVNLDVTRSNNLAAYLRSRFGM